MNWQIELEKKLNKVEKNEDVCIIIENEIAEISKNKKILKINDSLYKKIFQIINESFSNNNWSCCNSCLRFIWTLIQNHNLSYGDIEERNVKILLNIYYSVVSISKKEQLIELEFATLLRNITGFFMSWIDECYLFDSKYVSEEIECEINERQLPNFIKDKVMLDEYIFSLFELFTMLEPKRSNCNGVLEYLYIGHSFILASRYAAETYIMIQQITNNYQAIYKTLSEKMVNCIQRFLSCPDFDLQLILGELIWRILKNLNCSKNSKNFEFEKINFIDTFRSIWPEGLIQLKCVTADNFDYSFRGLLTPWNKTCNGNGKNIWSLSGILVNIEGLDIEILTTIDICVFSMNFFSDLDENEYLVNKSSNLGSNSNKERDERPVISTAEIPYWTIQSVIYVDKESKLILNVVFNELFEIKETWTGLFATNIENLGKKNLQKNDIFKIVININQEQAYHIMGIFKASKMQNIKSEKYLETPPRKISMVDSKSVSIERPGFSNKTDLIIESVEKCYENSHNVKSSIATSKSITKKITPEISKLKNEKSSFVSTKNLMKIDIDSECSGIQKKKNKADVIIIGLMNEQKRLTQNLKNCDFVDIPRAYDINFEKNLDSKKNNFSYRKKKKINNSKTYKSEISNNLKSSREKKKMRGKLLKENDSISKIKNLNLTKKSLKKDLKSYTEDNIEENTQGNKIKNSRVSVKNLNENNAHKKYDFKETKKACDLINTSQDIKEQNFKNNIEKENYKCEDTQINIQNDLKQKEAAKKEISTIKLNEKTDNFEVSTNQINKRLSGLKRRRTNKEVLNQENKQQVSKVEKHVCYNYNEAENNKVNDDKCLEIDIQQSEKNNYFTPKNDSKRNIDNGKLENNIDSNKNLTHLSTAEKTTCPTKNSQLKKFDNNKDMLNLFLKENKTIIPPEIEILNDDFQVLPDDTLNELEMKKRKYSHDKRTEKLLNRLYSEIKGSEFAEIELKDTNNNINDITPVVVKVKNKKNIKKKSKPKIEKNSFKVKDIHGKNNKKSDEDFLLSNNQEIIQSLINCEVGELSINNFDLNQDASNYIVDKFLNEINLKYDFSQLNSDDLNSKTNLNEMNFSKLNFDENSLIDSSFNEKIDSEYLNEEIPHNLRIANIKLEENDNLDNIIAKFEKCTKDLYSKCQKKLENYFFDVKKHLEKLWHEKNDKFQQKRKSLNEKVEISRINIEKEYQELRKKYMDNLEKVDARISEKVDHQVHEGNESFGLENYQEIADDKVIQKLKEKIESERKLTEKNLKVLKEKKEIEKNKYKEFKSKKLNFHEILKKYYNE